MGNLELESQQDYERIISDGQKLRESFGNIKDFFLDDKIDLSFQQEKYHEALTAIWNICNLYYPGKRLGITGPMLVSTEKLVDLGLVSQTTKEKIIKRLERKKEYGKKGDVVNNSILIEKNSNGFNITEAYVSEEESFGSNGEEIRLDSLVEEKTQLTVAEGKITITMEEKKSKPHLHALGKIWQSEDFNEEQFKPLLVTPKHINSTLALLAQCANLKIE